MCTLGPAAGYARRIAAIGDSHAAALIPAYRAVAEALHWRIDVAAKNACYWTTSAPKLRPAHVQACERWKQKLEQYLSEREPYEAIVVAHRAGAFQPDAAAGESQEETIVRGLLESWRRQLARGARVIVIRDNPVASAETSACILRHLARANERCSLDRSRALAAFDGQLAAARLQPGAHVVDLTPRFCDERSCPVVIGGVIVYRDDNHITATYSRTLAPFLAEELQKILG